METIYQFMIGFSFGYIIVDIIIKIIVAIKGD
jgi:hypothetical protein